nr:hypothetical protein CFP56_09074 [Quercus suber]
MILLQRSQDGAMVLACQINVDMEDALYPCPFPVAEMGLACMLPQHHAPGSSLSLNSKKNRAGSLINWGIETIVEDGMTRTSLRRITGTLECVAIEALRLSSSRRQGES